MRSGNIRKPIKVLIEGIHLPGLFILTMNVPKKSLAYTQGFFLPRKRPPRVACGRVKKLQCTLER